MNEPMFYCESIPPAGETARLRGDEAHHAIAARRLKRGDVLQLFDGHGNLARAQYQESGGSRREVELILTIKERQQVAPAKPTIHLACALPKGDRAAVLLDMATQLGMSSFTPLRCERSVVDPSENALQRLRRICLEACKQSRRAYIPEIRTPRTIEEVVARGSAIWIAHPDGEVVNRVLPKMGEDLTILIGPEGGFTEDEVAQASTHGATRVALGANILRIETAAVSLLGLALLGRPKT